MMAKTPITEEAEKAGEATPFGANTVTSASVGTVLKAGAGTITAFTLTQPTATQVDDTTPLTLLDIAAAPANINPPYPPRTIFSANMRALASLYEPRPGIGLTPGLTAPTWPKNVLGPAAVSIPFSNGCYVASCPANVTFTVTTA
jgi:hypothetical protein